MNTPQTEKTIVAVDHAQAPAVVWILVCLFAVAVGFYLGKQQFTGFATSSSESAHGSGKEIVLTEHTITDIARRANKWVVTIETEAANSQAKADHVVPSLTPHYPQQGAGAGIIIRQDGYIATSNHVLGVDKSVNVVLSNHKKYPAKVIGRDWFTDVAVLKVDDADLPAAELADVSRVEPGDWAIAIGTPMRLDHTVSLGIVSAVGRTISDTSVPGTDLIQTDAAINPGNSGGPLLNIHGQVIGMNTAVHRTAQNISFAVPIDEVSQVAQALIDQGHIGRGYIGLFMSSAHESAPPPDDQQDGVYVIFVAKGSPASKSGLYAGDIIKAVNGKAVENAADVRRIVMPLPPGEHVSLKVLRHGQLQDVGMALGESPADFKH